MSRLITALKQRKNCLIESPTGTGKSLSLLCGALSFVEEQRRLRTEAQLLKGLNKPSTMDQSSPQLSYTPAFEEDKMSLSQVHRANNIR